MLSRASSRALLTPWLSPYSHSPSRIFGSVASRPALPSRALIDSSNRPSSSPSSTRQIARAGCSASSSPSRSVGCRISCLRLASRSRTASSITAPPPLHLPPHHPYSTTLLRSLRLKKSQTRSRNLAPGVQCRLKHTLLNSVWRKRVPEGHMLSGLTVQDGVEVVDGASPVNLAPRQRTLT